MSNPETPQSEEEAVRQVILEGAQGDYTDVADAVKARFGMIVGSRLVEEVVVALRREAAEQEQSSSDASPTGANVPTEEVHNNVLAFVESMGGFDQARAAIDDLEATMRRLMN